VLGKGAKVPDRGKGFEKGKMEVWVGSMSWQWGRGCSEKEMQRWVKARQEVLKNAKWL
jgi:hypothetical protein